MKRNGNTCVEVCHQKVENLIVVPRLFDPPSQGWVSWSTLMAEIMQGDSPTKDWERYVPLVLDKIDLGNQVQVKKIVNEDTISGRLIAGTGPAWRYGLILPTVLSGDFEKVLAEDLCNDQQALPGTADLVTQIMSAEQLEELILLEGQVNSAPYHRTTTMLRRLINARRVRIRFEMGHPLYIGVYNSEERYRRVVPIMTYMGDGKYSVGQPPLCAEFQAPDHPHALDKARQWFLEKRELEIQAAKDAARDIALDGTPPMVYDLLIAVLRSDKQLFDDEGVRVAWENGAHGLYGFQGPDWCYTASCSTEKAVQMAMVAMRQAADSKLLVRLTDRVAGYLGFDSIREEEDGGYSWDSYLVNRWQPAPDVSVNGEIKGRALTTSGDTAFLTHIIRNDPNTDSSIPFSHKVRVLGKGNKVLAESAVPARWELGDTDVLFWSLRVGINQLQKQKNR